MVPTHACNAQAYFLIQRPVNRYSCLVLVMPSDAVLWICVSFLSAAALTSGHSSYVAAVYEHRVISNPEPRVPLSRSAALRHVQQNLDVYEEQAALAAEQVNVLCFYKAKSKVQHKLKLSPSPSCCLFRSGWSTVLLLIPYYKNSKYDY